MPVRDVLVGDAGRYVEHDDATLAVDVVAIPQTTEFLLSSSIPDVELNFAEILNETSMRFSPQRDRIEENVLL